MSVAGLKKQLHKASQLLNEKINGVEGTKLDEDFIRMEKKFEITQKLILDLVPKTTEYLQPNPAYRAKLSMLNTVSRIRGQVKTVGYPQTEGMLGDCMLRYGSELGIESAFGCALVDMGQALKQMAQIRDCLDVRVKHSFIDPLQTLQDKELKEIMYHLRKLEGRRLDFDYKKRRKGKIADSEIKQALEKFEESKELAERSMFNLLHSDVEQMQQLLGLVDAALDYHRQSSLVLENVRSSLQNRITDASNRPKQDFRSKSIASTMCYTDIYGFSTCSSVRSSDVTPVVHTLNQTPVKPQISEHPAYKNGNDFHLDQPCCRAIYNFKPENQGELGFKEGDFIILTNQIDENWYEGLLSGESGFFPISYVKVLVPLPQ
ncbi:endophilin-A3b isoform X2 [Astyanax mexicanus]|uniref:Endophilin-A3 n=1 Tax=Astyanax mexicanus TaxID=7994 RepID=A0A8B9HPT1_ASTMX|nr:endophilin-A3b isoform X2 [Astyanax mexicanus]KAG9272428.1 endophilin-A3 isoform X2 [Astyanax mexicanus]